MAENEQPQKKDVYFTIRRVGDVWDVDGQLQTEDMRDVLDLIMILMTNAVRVALTVTNIDRSLKPMEKALTAQLKDIIKAEAKEVRDERKANQSERQEATADSIEEAR
jgi:hypothetical protein